MNSTIWKYRLRATDDQQIMMPAGAQILSVGVQQERVQLWAMVDPMNPLAQNRRIVMVGTGHVVPPACGRFIGTVSLFEGALILHVFDAS